MFNNNSYGRLRKGKCVSVLGVCACLCGKVMSPKHTVFFTVILDICLHCVFSSSFAFFSIIILFSTSV